MSTHAWLRELGAKRPMAPAGKTVLVLGDVTDGFYPIEWEVIPSSKQWDASCCQWVKTPTRVSNGDCSALSANH